MTTGTGSSATSRIASRLARSPGPAGSASWGSSWGSGVSASLVISLVVAFGQLIDTISVWVDACLVEVFGPRPGHVELAKRSDLLEGHRILPVQLEQGQERGHHLIAPGRPRRQLPEASPSEFGQQSRDDLGLL